MHIAGQALEAGEVRRKRVTQRGVSRQGREVAQIIFGDDEFTHQIDERVDACRVDAHRARSIVGASICRLCGSRGGSGKSNILNDRDLVGHCVQRMPDCSDRRITEGLDDEAAIVDVHASGDPRLTPRNMQEEQLRDGTSDEHRILALQEAVFGWLVSYGSDRRG